MTGEPLALPPEYATPAKTLAWSDAGGVWRLRPSKVMAWTSLPVDFGFAGG